MDWRNLSTKQWLYCSLALFFVAYYFAASAPFYLDDFTSIVENPILRNGATLGALMNNYPMRFIGYLSFVLDYQLFDVEPYWFRLQNFIIHGLLALTLSVLLFRFTKQKALAAALAVVFLVHPLNTQAVTYIVQRLAELTALWVTLSALFYYLSREGNTLRWHWALLSIAFFVVALFTKENAVITPLLWYAIDRFIVRQKQAWKWDIVGLLAATLVAALVAWQLWPTIDKLTREADNVTRLDYFLAQGPILWAYIGKFFIPVQLKLEYGITHNIYPLWLSLVAWAGHLAVIVAAFMLRKCLPLLTLGIAWYYIAHSVESSLIPITDFAFEHRNYLPNIGLIIAFVPAVLWVSQQDKLWARWLVPAIIVVLTLVSAHRNYLWADANRFYQNEYAHNPDNVRVQSELAQAAYKAEDYERAATMYDHLINNRGMNDEAVYISAIASHIKLENWERVEALEATAFKRINKYHPSYRARLYLNRGIRLKEQDNCKAAYKDFERVQRMFPGEFSSILFRTQCDVKTGNWERAEKIIKELNQAAPNEPRVQALMEAYIKHSQ